MRDLDFVLQPDVYRTTQDYSNLGEILSGIWGKAPEESVLYAAAGFVDLGGVLPFVNAFKKHIEDGGGVRCFFAGSPSSALASRQAVHELLSIEASVRLLSRRKMFHSKLYGVSANSADRLVVSSANLTGNGLAMNVESTLIVGSELLSRCGFSWTEWERKVEEGFEWHEPSLASSRDASDPAWKLTYDEKRGAPQAEPPSPSTDEALVTTLSAIDVARVKDPTYAGTPYFWLSRYVMDYFPPLVVRTRPGAKKTFTADVEVDFLNIGQTKKVTVTFEAYNNKDFRLLVSPLKGTKVAKEGDIAILYRVGADQYKLKVLDARSRDAGRLRPYMITFVGHKGKRYGFVPIGMVKRLLR